GVWVDDRTDCSVYRIPHTATPPLHHASTAPPPHRPSDRGPQPQLATAPEPQVSARKDPDPALTHYPDRPLNSRMGRICSNIFVTVWSYGDITLLSALEPWF